MTVLAYAGAALAEIAGCFAFWAWLRLGASPWWLLPGLASLALFAFLLTLADSEAAGRTYAAYGGIYVAASTLWLWLAEGYRPDRWDLGGSRLPGGHGNHPVGPSTMTHLGWATLGVLALYLAAFAGLGRLAARAAGRSVWLFGQARGRDRFAALAFRAAFAFALLGP